MFEFLFKYPRTVFSKGTFVLLGDWPVWALIAALAVVAAGLGWVFWSRRSFLKYPGRIVLEFLPAIPPGTLAAMTVILSAAIVMTL